MIVTAISHIIQNIGYFLAVIVIVVLIHELGHYVVARWRGVAVSTFSIGFGPELFGWNNRHGTRFCLSSIPLGGYIRMEGWSEKEFNEMPSEQRHGGFFGKPLWARMLIVSAGPFANFLLAIVLFSGLYMTQGAPAIDRADGIAIGEILPNSPSQLAGLQQGDRILRIDGEEVDDFATIVKVVRASGGRMLVLSLMRNSQPLMLTVRPQVLGEDGVYRIGVRLAHAPVIRLAAHHAIWRATNESIRLSREILIAIKELVTGARSTDDLSGPVRLAQISGEAGRAGGTIFLSFTAILSINLGLLNLLPLPVLDGGHLLMYTIEILRRKRLSERVQQALSVCGFVLILTLMLWVTGQDILRLLTP